MISAGVAMTGHSSAKMVTLHIPQTPGKKYSGQRDFAKFHSARRRPKVESLVSKDPKILEASRRL